MNVVELEQSLVEKSFYKTLAQKYDLEPTLEALGEIFDKKQRETPTDLHSIRFAQGEMYFHIRDYEAAIFKWEAIQEDEFLPWAKKNIADAYLELDLLDVAKGIYQSITTDSLVLNTEIALQLFYIYHTEGQIVEAKQMIQNALTMNPTYRDIPLIAKRFFEEIEDWKNAMEIAVNELLRTKEEYWVNVLEAYIKNDYIDHEPSYFIPALKKSFYINKDKFITIATNLWNYFKGKDNFLEWLVEWNTFICELEFVDEDLTPFDSLYNETYTELMSGQTNFELAQKIMPLLLEAWIKVNGQQSHLFLASAVLAWNDLFPGNIDEKTRKMAQQLIVASEEKEKWTSMNNQLLTDLYNDVQNWIQLNDFRWDDEIPLVASPTERLTYLKNMVHRLYEQQSQVERELLDSVEKDEDIVSRLNGTFHQLQDIEEERTKELQLEFKRFKEEIKNNLLEKIPEIIKGTTSIIKDDSDLRTIHLELNTEMNERIQAYLKEEVLPVVKTSLEDWIYFSESKLYDSQEQLSDWSKSFNQLLEENRIELHCDFQVIDDWKRDADRLTSTIEVGKENILLRRTPSQVLLKGAGKLFAVIQKNNAMMIQAYRNFVQNEDYKDVATSIANKFLRQFELFETAIARDVHLFFKGPQSTLNEIVNELNQKIEMYKEKLKQIKENPTLYSGPLKIFEVRIQQVEWMLDALKSQEIDGPAFEMPTDSSNESL